MRIITDSLLEYIKSEIEQIEYGSVVIKLVGDSDKIDVISESRQRFGVEKIK